MQPILKSQTLVYWIHSLWLSNIKFKRFKIKYIQSLNLVTAKNLWTNFNYNGLSIITHGAFYLFI